MTINQGDGHPRDTTNLCESVTDAVLEQECARTRAEATLDIGLCEGITLPETGDDEEDAGGVPAHQRPWSLAPVRLVSLEGESRCSNVRAAATEGATRVQRANGETPLS